MRKRKLMELIACLAGVYVAICVVAYFVNRQFMYFPDPTRIAPAEVGLDDVEEIEIPAADGTTLVAWHASPKAAHCAASAWIKW